MRIKFYAILVIMGLVTVTPAVAAQHQVTVIVKKINDFSESGDGYTFTTKSGKEYYIYNAGGGSPIKGEINIVHSANKGIPVCLTLNPADGMGDIASVNKGKCKK